MKNTQYMIHFTKSQKDDLVEWVSENLGIKGMDKLYKQITRNDEVNYDSDKDGFFFQAQITRQLTRSERYDITQVEDDGGDYDIDIELDGCIQLQVWFGGNKVGYDLNRQIKKHNPLWEFSSATCLPKDLSKLQDKLGRQLNKPILDDVCSVKILIVMSRTLLPLHFLPEWGYPLKNRTIIELRGGFDEVGNLCGEATLHHSNKLWDKTVKDIVDALGFRYVESFNTLGVGWSSIRFGGLSSMPWQSSYLNTASQHIHLQPKVMAFGLNPDVVDEEFFMALGYGTSTEGIRNFMHNELQQMVSQVIWADVEQSDYGMTSMLGPDYPEPMDKIIANQALAKDKPGLYNPYGGRIDRDKTNAYDATVVDAGGNDLEIDHVYALLDGIRSRSKKRPDWFLVDPSVLWRMIELGVMSGYYGSMSVQLKNNDTIQVSSFMGIPVWDDFGVGGLNKGGCIYAISTKDELGIPSGLRLLASSFHNTVSRQYQSIDDRIAYVVGETAVDPRACGKIVNIRERW